ncbi:D-alanyl-D-alanine carboxypeptidase [Insolitispirillum peregrinum]|uniref:D-alanyl-D-alanine carboxypeptidase n=1 Tax=Insolitispirillum peregrinum TaxID=80876 RepID=A0A1N7Q7C9_9PROT|nr:D-alanyl-D-alanine carboxypeptidase [Insolitispirillum peregrinum]
MIENAGWNTERIVRPALRPARTALAVNLRYSLALALLTITLLASTTGGAWARYASIIINAQTGQVLWEKNADDRNYPASLTKMMTLYMLFDSLEKGKTRMTSQMGVSSHAAAQAPSKLGLRPGSSLRVEDAIKALVTKSANDAAVVIAEYIGGDEATFAQMMTNQARRLGMTQTTFRNASGLPNPGQMSSARDMATLSIALQRNFPQYYHYFSLRAFDYNGTVIPTHNRVLLNYPGADGLKTGFIAASGFNLAASANRNGVRLVGVVFGGKTASWRDQHMMDLLDDGFRVAGGMARRGTPVPEDDDNARKAPKVAAAPEVTKPAVVAKVEKTSTQPKANAGGQTQLPNTLKNSWGIQIGAFSSLSIAQNQAATAASRIRSQAKSVQPAVTSAKSGASTLYRARVLGLSSEQTARSACNTLKGKEKSCVIIRPGATEMAYLP